MAQRGLRPKTKILREVYKELVSPSIAIRLGSLSKALAWFDSALDYAASRGRKFTEEQQKALVLGTKAKSLGISTAYNEEKENAFRLAVRNFEKVASRLHPPPIEKAYARLEARMGQLTARLTRLEARYQVLRLLQTALSPKTISGRLLSIFVTASQHVSRQADPELSHLVYSVDLAEKLRRMLRDVGFLSVVAQELPFVSRAASLAVDGHGGYASDPQVQLTKMQEMLVSFAEFCQTAQAPRRLVRQKVEGELTSGPKEKAVAHGPRPPRSGEKVAGRYTKGSAMATLYEVLSDGALHEKDELRPLISANLESRLRDVKKDGRRFGTWTLREQGTAVQMSLTVQGS